MAVIAYDLGASSGRALVGRLSGSRIEVSEVHRFSNDPVQVGNRLHWDILRLFHEMKQGLLKAKQQGIQPESIGIDSWAVDFGLIGKNGELLGNPYHYRDSHTDGVMEKLLEEIPSADIYSRTGIQFLPFNTIYQLLAMKAADSPLLRDAKRFLMIPDLLRYFLTGDMHNEFTNATTTQLYNPIKGEWDAALLRRLDLPAAWFGPVLQPGTPAGQLRSSLAAELGTGSVPVIAVAEHDTGSAVVAVPATERSFAYLCCGTWSLMGTEVDQPILSPLALDLNFTNEGGAAGKYRLLKNIMGLWILQECQREWASSGKVYTFPELVAMAEQAAPFTAWINPDDTRFLRPGGMQDRIRGYCEETRQPVPSEPGAFVRCILESLALKYRYVLRQTERLTGSRFSGLHIVGGGIHNTLLCRWSANAVGKPVWAGPAESSAIGNLAMQWIAQGQFKDVGEARAAIRDSFSLTVYEPEQTDVWQNAYGQFLTITGLAE
ncbi:rhamnulokinase [Paenibacillus sp. J31TS4]|uniref:rhamnulokinase n=1 Tax=Paenibacillus sp. J31TS4 TaxID=2807195 RepID=UPI001BCCF3DB|nr:rhamnulokinase [Paenibacillus sp. J31TS4]